MIWFLFKCFCHRLSNTLIILSENVTETITLLKDGCGILIRWWLLIKFWITYRRKLIDFDELIVFKWFCKYSSVKIIILHLEVVTFHFEIMSVARFLKVLGIIQWYLFKRKNGSSSLFKFFLLFREVYKNFYQVKWISWISSVVNWTVANVPNELNGQASVLRKLLLSDQLLKAMYGKYLWWLFKLKLLHTP